MTIHETSIKDLLVITPKVFLDDRGYFFESFNLKASKGTPLENYNWVQENESQSTKGVLRGLHFQKGDAAQAKLVRVIKGEVFDVAVDLREHSDTYGKWHAELLSEDNKTQFLVPRGFAHGFLVLSETAIFAYKCDNFYIPSQDSGIIYDDANLNIDWPSIDVALQLSSKDLTLNTFENSYKF